LKGKREWKNEKWKEDAERRREEKERRTNDRKEGERMERLSCSVLYYISKEVGNRVWARFNFRTEMGILLTFSSRKKSGFSISSIKKSGISFEQ
jgi:hypothetical protein